MTNADKYLKDGVDAADVYNKFSVWCKEKGYCLDADSFYDFMKSLIRPTLTEDEKVILKQLKKNYCGIGKNTYNCFLLRETKSGYGQIGVSLDIMLTGLFQFIQPRRRI